MPIRWLPARCWGPMRAPGLGQVDVKERMQGPPRLGRVGRSVHNHTHTWGGAWLLRTPLRLQGHVLVGFSVEQLWVVVVVPRVRKRVCASRRGRTPCKRACECWATQGSARQGTHPPPPLQAPQRQRQASLALLLWRQPPAAPHPRPQSRGRGWTASLSPAGPLPQAGGPRNRAWGMPAGCEGEHSNQKTLMPMIMDPVAKVMAACEADIQACSLGQPCRWDGEGRAG